MELIVKVHSVFDDGCVSGTPARHVISMARAEFSEEAITSAPKKLQRHVLSNSLMITHCGILTNNAFNIVSFYINFK